MKTLKEKFGQFEMTKEQMKMIKGGEWQRCVCNQGVGTWEGNYSSVAQRDAAVANYCSSAGATCGPQQ